MMTRADEFLSPVLIRRFLKAVAKCGNLSAACRKVQPDNWENFRSSVKARRRTDADFSQAVDESLDDYADRLEDVADRRAVEGVKTLRLHKGETIIDPRTGDFLEETQYSDRLLIERLRALRPQRYARQVLTRIDFRARIVRMIQHVGFIVTDADARYLSDDQIRQLRAIKSAIEDGRRLNIYDPIHGAIEGVAEEVETVARAAIEDKSE